MSNAELVQLYLAYFGRPPELLHVTGVRFAETGQVVIVGGAVDVMGGEYEVVGTDPGTRGVTELKRVLPAEIPVPVSFLDRADQRQASQERYAGIKAVQRHQESFARVRLKQVRRR